MREDANLWTKIPLTIIAIAIIIIIIIIIIITFIVFFWGGEWNINFINIVTKIRKREDKK